MNLKHLAAFAAVAALAVPTAATADAGKGRSGDAPKPGTTEHASKGKGQAKAKNAVFKGSVVAVDAAAGTVTVTVAKANKWGRRFKGSDVEFTTAGVKKVNVADRNADGKRDLADVAVGDKVNVHARITKEQAPPLAARKLNVTTPEADEDEQEEEAAPAPAPAP